MVSCRVNASTRTCTTGLAYFNQTFLERAVEELERDRGKLKHALNARQERAAAAKLLTNSGFCNCFARLCPESWAVLIYAETALRWHI